MIKRGRRIHTGCANITSTLLLLDPEKISILLFNSNKLTSTGSKKKASKNDKLEKRIMFCVFFVP